MTDQNPKLKGEEAQMMQLVKVQCPRLENRAEQGENASVRAKTGSPAQLRVLGVCDKWVYVEYFQGSELQHSQPR